MPTRIGGGLAVRRVITPQLSLWDPSVLEPIMWLEPRNGEFTTTTTFEVDTVSDRSASANTFQNGGTMNRPGMAWTHSEFKRRVVDFSGSSQALVTANAVDLSSGYLLWALVHADVDTSTRYLLRSSVATHGFNRNDGGDWRLLFGTSSGAADSLVIADTGTGVRALLFHYDGAGVASGWLNDWSAAAQTIDRSASGNLTAPNDTLYIGAVNGSGSSPFNGQIASMGVVPMASAPTSDQRDALGLYLNEQFQSSITTTIADPANLPGYSGVKAPPQQIVVLGIGQSNRAHNPDTTLEDGPSPPATELPLITDGGGARYQEEYPITLHEFVQGGTTSVPQHYVIRNRGTPTNWRFGRELVWAHRFANAGPDIEGYIAKAAYGATSIADDWDPDTAQSTTIEDPGWMYWWGVDRLTEIANNIRPGARFIVGWTQGETEANEGASTYESDQANLFDGIVSLASSLGLAAPEFYDTLLHEDWENPPPHAPERPYWQDVQDAKAAVAAARSDVTLISQPSSIPLQTAEMDDIHLTAEGQCLMGEAEANAAGF